ncbi:MAG: sugar nucleotide-binding protein, partial [Dactylosporangium sp.]|nr:sugar nucleotide-binding protein [Dactylosporangium sp.]NNJ63607.1 sugar nucleotide-binding protein [Dactylosporangium sp.]
MTEPTMGGTARRGPGTDGPVLVVGRGLIGSALADRLAGITRVLTVATRGGDHPDHVGLDLATPGGRGGLGELIGRERPRRVVLTHGPSDVTWIESHEPRAAEVHRAVAEVVRDARVPAILVSTDNVFPGTRPGYRDGDPVGPTNAYGRIKESCERALASGGDHLVLRVSLVYGWAAPRHRATYAERCLAAATAAEPLEAPTDQEFTPIHVDDVARALAALSLAPDPVGGVRHLAGPDLVSRHDFAVRAYAAWDADPGLVRPCLRAETHLASRPRYSAMVSSDLSEVPGLDGWCPAGVERGLGAMLASRPRPGPAAE